MSERRLLIVGHVPSPNTLRLREAAVRGASSPDIEGVEVWQKHAAFCEHLPDHWRQQARVLSCLLLVALNYDVANPQCHRACKRGRVYREQIHATAPLRSCAARKDETSVSDAVDGIGASAWRNLLP